MSIRNLFDYSVPMVAAATILALGAVVVGGMATHTARDIKLAQDTVEVTGSAKRAVVSDTARWTIGLEARTGPFEQSLGYDRIQQATDRVVAFLTEQGFTEIETPAITSYPQYNYPQYGEPVFTGYSVGRSVMVRSGDVEKLQALTNSIEPFSGTGYTVTTQMFELTYSKLAEMRVDLLSEAITDAKARAEAIASESGRQVGTLRQATGGVVQVLPQGGVDISDSGYYDTQSLNKEVMVTVRAAFELW